MHMCTAYTVLQVFTDVFQNSYQLVSAQPRQHTYLACALLMRGDVVAGGACRSRRCMPRLLCALCR